MNACVAYQIADQGFIARQCGTARCGEAGQAGSELQKTAAGGCLRHDAANVAFRGRTQGWRSQPALIADHNQPAVAGFRAPGLAGAAQAIWRTCAPRGRSGSSQILGLGIEWTIALVMKSVSQPCPARRHKPNSSGCPNCSATARSSRSRPLGHTRRPAGSPEADPEQRVELVQTRRGPAPFSRGSTIVTSPVVCRSCRGGRRRARRSRPRRRRDGDAIRRGAATSSFVLTGAGIDIAVHAVLPGEPVDAVLVEHARCRDWRRHLRWQRVVVELLAPRRSDIGVEPAVGQPRRAVRPDDHAMRRRAGPIRCFRLPGWDNQSEVPLPWPEYQTLPSATAVTSWGREPCSTGKYETRRWRTRGREPERG